MTRHRRPQNTDDGSWSWPPRDELEVVDLESGRPRKPPREEGDPEAAADADGLETEQGAAEPEPHSYEPEPHSHEPEAPSYESGILPDAVPDDYREPVVRPPRGARTDEPREAEEPASPSAAGGWTALRQRLGRPAVSSPGGRRWFTPEHVLLLVLAAAALGQAVYILVSTSRKPPASGQAAFTQSGSVGTSGNTRTSKASSSASPAAAATSTPATGYLAVRTQPAGGSVYVDGKRLGVAPVTVPELTAGRHSITIRSRTQTIEHQVNISPGEVVSLVVPLTGGGGGGGGGAADSSQGSLAVRAPVELRIFEGDRLVGTSAMDQMPLTPGTHRLQLTNEAVGYRQERSVTASAGKTTTLQVEMPNERANINAVPWAEVWVDGKRVGETPIGGLPLPLGPHVVVLRHPQLGEKTVNTVVKANEPPRISLDMRK